MPVHTRTAPAFYTWGPNLTAPAILTDYCSGHINSCFIVENEASIQHMLEEALTDGGFTVTIANSGEQAVTMLDKDGADYSALITDINLSGTLTGWDVAKHARESQRQAAGHLYDWSECP